MKVCSFGCNRRQQMKNEDGFFPLNIYLLGCTGGAALHCTSLTQLGVMLPQENVKF